MNGSAVPTKAFRTDINALRAIAIIGVLLFHYQVTYFEGGFAGVDVFFVISGYLMTKIIVTGVDSGSFSLLNFYSKRLKRIIPALLFLIIVITIVGFFFIFPKDYRSVEQNATASLLFLSNIFYWKTANYFTVKNDNMLLHTWSLSVEWQFYLFFPIIFIGLYKIFKTKKQQLIVFAIVALLLFVCAVMRSRVDSASAFYLLPTRAWEMLFGGIAFYGEGFFKAVKWRKVIAITGYVVIILCFVILKKSEVSWPGVYTMLPVFATFLIIVVNYTDFRLPELPAFQFVGKISYSLYLWHWPVFVFAQYMLVQITPLSTVCLMLLSIILGYISYKVVEKRVYKSNKFIGSIAIIMLLATGCLSYFEVNAMQFKQGALQIAEYRELYDGIWTTKDRKEKKWNDCWISSNSGHPFNKENCLPLSDEKANILLVGDSHAKHFAQPLRDLFKNRNINLLQATASGCFPVIRPNGIKRCSVIIEYIFKDFMKNNSRKINGVIISASWAGHIKDSVQTLQDLNNTLKYLKALNIKAVVIGQNESYKISYPIICAHEYQYATAISRSYLLPEAFQMNSFLKRELKQNYIDIYNYGEVPKPIDNIPYMFDGGHFTKVRANHAAKKILSNSRFLDMIQ